MKTLLILATIATLSALAQASDVPELRCFGTEPFWGLSTDSFGTLSMDDPATEGSQIYSKATIKNALGTADGLAFQIEAKNKFKKSIKLNVVKSECSDGMSEEVYPYTVLVDVNNGVLFGCCRK